MWLRLGVRAGGQLDAEIEDEARPAGAVREAQLPAHLARQLAADAQPQAEAALTRGRAAALEALEDALAILGEDPGPLIVHGDRGGLAVIGGDHAHGRGRRRVAQG